VLEDISSSTLHEEYRGVQSDHAIELYAKSMGESRSGELFSMIKRLHNTAAMNTEALRKLVKKFDKGAEPRGDEVLSSTLLQELYCSSFSSFQCLEVYIEILRDSLVESDEEASEDEDTESDVHSVQQKGVFNDSSDVKRREMVWLKSMIASIPKCVCEALVAHRGFHCPRDGTNRRPLENSLSAFEIAWSSGGIELCECDVALTKDEKLVLAHDEDFSRLALEPNSTSSKTKVQDLTMKEIISLTFKSGSRPPLLLDVLRSAHAIGGNCRLVIEIKPGNQEACSALVRLFKHHPELLDRCAVIMSFDGYTMHRLKSELEEMRASFMSECVGSSPPQKARHLAREDISVKLPEVMLLTVAKKPKMHYELCFDILNPSPIHSWLKHGNQTSLDGGEFIVTTETSRGFFAILIIQMFC
jgi:glycerophosphoryl diester phosphodiesterase